MFREKTQRRLNQISPWLLFAAWLAVSAAKLWTQEIDAVREGVFSCRSDTPISFSRGPQWIQDLLKRWTV